MPVEFCCPLHHEALDRSNPTKWRCARCDEDYPLIDDIPVLLPDPAERNRVANTDWSSPPSSHASPIDFYNQATYEEIYARAEQPLERREIALRLADAPLKGPTLEIGSGRGGLQGLGDEYVALDYSFTALRKHIHPKFHRVCATAEQLPFFDSTFGFIFTVTSLEHVPRVDRAFEEIHRVLRSGGTAFLAPAWHCVQWVCDGVRVRPYSDLTIAQKWRKLTLPIRRQTLAKALATLPARLVRRMLWSIRRGPARFRFKRLQADYQHFWESDCDACSRLDSHEACLFFHSRGYDVLSPGPGALRQLLARHQAIIVRKP